MGLISRVSSRTYRYKNSQMRIGKWHFSSMPRSIPRWVWRHELFRIFMALMFFMVVMHVYHKKVFGGHKLPDDIHHKIRQHHIDHGLEHMIEHLNLHPHPEYGWGE